MAEETLIWKGQPSQWKNLGLYIFCGLTCPIIIPLFVALGRFLSTKFTKYEITSERIKITTGILSKKIEEMELYRVKDTTFEQPFLMRLLKLGHIRIRTSDLSTPHLVIEAIENAEDLRNKIRKHVETRRDVKGVREADLR